MYMYMKNTVLESDKYPFLTTKSPGYLGGKGKPYPRDTLGWKWLSGGIPLHFSRPGLRQKKRPSLRVSLPLLVTRVKDGNFVVMAERHWSTRSVDILKVKTHWICVTLQCWTLESVHVHLGQLYIDRVQPTCIQSGSVRRRVVAGRQGGRKHFGTI